MTDDDPVSEHEHRVNQIIADYLDAHHRGQTPNREELLGRHPELADELRAFFANQDQFRRLAEPLAPGAVPESAQEGAPTVTFSENAGTDPVLGTVRYFGDYELLEELARGGMGVVYKARQTSLNRVVALKMILSGQFAAPLDVQRFRAEAETAANLDHPNIVPIYEIGAHAGQQYFSMKLIAGHNLGEKMNHLKQYPRKAAQVLATVARAVQFAHRCGVLHRDLKPANILLDAEDQPYVTDFGLAKRPLVSDGSVGAERLTQSGAIVGTPNYMAPEQARAQKAVTTAVDVYALGAILYECLTGQPPFRAATPLDTLLQVMEGTPAAPTALNPQADSSLSAVALKCLEKDPSRRYPSAEALADDLDRWLNGESVTAQAPGFLDRCLNAMGLGRNQSPLAPTSAVRKAILGTMGAGTCYGAVLAAVVFTSIGQTALDHRTESALTPDLVSHPLFFHFLLEGALVMGLAISANQVLRQSRPGPPVSRHMLALLSAWLTIMALVLTGMVAQGLPSAEGDRPFWVVRWLCYTLLPLLVLGSVGTVLNKRLYILGSFMMLFVSTFVVLAVPVAGYLIGTAIALVPGASALAPLYGTMLGIALCVFVHGRPFFMGGLPSSFGLLNNENVQKEIELTLGQLAQALRVARKVEQDNVEQTTALSPDLGEDAQAEALQELANKFREETASALATILTPAQMERYKQIDFQNHGLYAFLFPDVQQTLKLNAEQKKEIKIRADEFQRQNREQLLEISKGWSSALGWLKALVNRGWFDAMVKQQVRSRELGETIASDLFDAEQKAIWKTLRGEPFKGWRTDVPWG